MTGGMVDCAWNEEFSFKRACQVGPGFGLSSSMLRHPASSTGQETSKPPFKDLVSCNRSSVTRAVSFRGLQSSIC